MGKYDSLAKYLIETNLDKVSLSFQQIEKIIGHHLPPSAKVHPAWWGNHIGNPQASWVRAGFKIYVDSNKEEATFIKQSNPIDFTDRPVKHQRKQIGRNVAIRMESRLNDLIQGFDTYADYFDKSILFTGPCQYFHIATLNRVRKVGVSQILENEDDPFYELVYATLVSWGMHRMGSGGAKMPDFSVFKSGIISQRDDILSLKDKNLATLHSDEIPSITADLWKIIQSLKGSTTNARLVANSKTMHHLLPELVPPIDREYTLIFYYGRKNINEEMAFKQIYPYMHQIATEKRASILKRVVHGTFNSSATKIIDNAIIGYVLKELKKK